MKRPLLLLLLILSSPAIHAQDITGFWNSADGTRTYEVKKTRANMFIAVIKSSVRKTDSIGYAVIRDLKFNSRKKRYEGLIYAVSDNEPTFVKIRVYEDGNRILLKLNRMFIFNVSINWKRVVNRNT